MTTQPNSRVFNLQSWKNLTSTIRPLYINNSNVYIAANLREKSNLLDSFTDPYRVGIVFVQVPWDGAQEEGGAFVKVPLPWSGPRSSFFEGVSPGSEQGESMFWMSLLCLPFPPFRSA